MIGELKVTFAVLRIPTPTPAKGTAVVPKVPVPEYVCANEPEKSKREEAAVPTMLPLFNTFPVTDAVKPVVAL